MLANTGRPSRPRPPAQVRRSTSVSTTTKSSPPPPYGSSFVFPQKTSQDVLLGSPVSAIARLIGWEGSGAAPLTPSPGARGEMLDWLNERSRDELSQLLLKAEGVIKQRETELDRTSSLCKALYEDNASLQSKHKTLLTRIPSTPSNVSSPLPADSPLPSPTRTSSSYSSFSNTPGSSDPFQYSSPTGSNSPYPVGGGSRRHVRKISVTPADISLLADQNAELLLKIEKLESESESTDLAGRRMLKRLEKEIGALRQELESVKEAEEKNQLTVKKSRPLRSVSGPIQRAQEAPKDEDDVCNDEIRDFAPRGSITTSTSAPGLFSRSKGIFSGSEYFSGAEENSALSHLLTKIHELEETNIRILSQQAETAEKLRVVQRETEGLGRVYDGLEGLGLGPDVEVEIVDASEDDDNQQDDEFGHNNETIRFRSFRKSLMESLPPPPIDGRGHAGAGTAFGTGSAKSLASSLASVASRHRSRKSVMGLFDSGSPSPSFGAARARAHSASLHRNSWSLDSSRSTAVQTSSALSSPALSTLSLSLNPLSSPLPYRYHETLSSELGENLDNESDPSYHLRTSSLYSLSLGIGMGGSAPASRSPSPSPSPSPIVDEARGGYMPERKESQAESETPVKSPVGLQLTVEPPTPVKFPEMGPTDGDGEMPLSKHTLRYRRMSQTVKSRTAMWVDGRFKDTLLGGGVSRERRGMPLFDEGLEDKGKGSSRPASSKSGSSSKGTPTPTPTPTALSTPVGLGPLKLVSSAINLVEKFTSHAGLSSPLSLTPPTSARLPATNDHDHNPDSPRAVQTETLPTTEEAATSQLVQLYVEPSNAIEKRDAEQGPATKFGAFVLEVWLWLQFAIIILVFLWAMAKRGPKSVLGEAVAAEQRKLARG